MPSVAMSCPICYTDDDDMIVCWNDHCLCETCYRECLKPRIRYDVISGVNKYHVNNKCPICRESMFDWFNLVIENMNNTMIPPVRRRQTLEEIREETRRLILSLSTPTNIGWTDLQANVREPIQVQQPVQRRRIRCGECSQIGHNRRTCPNRT